MVESVNWAKTLLTKRYGDRLVRDNGIDFDGNDKIEGPEKFGDLNGGTKTSDEEDYTFYLEANQPYIEKNIKSIGSQKDFSPNNIIHQVLSIESEMHSEADIKRAYEILGAVLTQVKQEINNDLTDQEKVQLVYAILRRQAFTFEAQSEPLFTNNLLRRSVDCDSSSLIVLAIAQELDWPVSLVYVPLHVFVRWQGHYYASFTWRQNTSSFNVDYGNINSDEYYRQEFSWDGSILDQAGVVTLIYQNRGYLKCKLGMYREAIADLNEAVRLAPNNTNAYINRG
ncbi:MAG: tetratricopeptide repeat protein, partial [Candidatus Margulisbacteria bacterium]|nr:tetratricopeptide repeat protein [Candidatus Margulisiibacteriota bacterium]